MAARPCPICNGPAHPVAGEFIPGKRDRVSAALYRIMHHHMRATRNTAWHEIQDAVKTAMIGAVTYGTGYMRVQ